MFREAVCLLLIMALCTGAPSSSKWAKLSPASPIADEHVLRFEASVDVEQEWTLFKSQYDRTYSVDEESMRKLIFAENLKTITIHNYLYDRGLKSFTMGINQFSDMTVQEFVNAMNGYQRTNTTSTGATYLSPNVNVTLPASVDWRTRGYVTPIKNQLECGSCWAFSATGSLEGQHFRKYRILTPLSEQNLVDCSRAFGNYGCNGGWMQNAFKYIRANGGIDTEYSYRYEARNGPCRYNPRSVGATCRGYVELPTGNEQKLQEAVATVGPISVAIDASQASFKHYKSGVYNDPQCSSTQVDHAVLVVGYGTMKGSDYWLVKNSWGTTWGVQGYVYMSRNKRNQCGIARSASYPLV